MISFLFSSGLYAFSRLQGRVSTEEVFALTNSDLVPGKYEGSYSPKLISEV